MPQTYLADEMMNDQVLVRKSVYLSEDSVELAVYQFDFFLEKK